MVTLLSVAMTKVTNAIRGGADYIRVQPRSHPRKVVVVCRMW